MAVVVVDVCELRALAQERLASYIIIALHEAISVLNVSGQTICLPPGKQFSALPNVLVLSSRSLSTLSTTPIFRKNQAMIRLGLTVRAGRKGGSGGGDYYDDDDERGMVVCNVCRRHSSAASQAGG